MTFGFAHFTYSITTDDDDDDDDSEFLQDEDFGNVDGQFLHAEWWLWTPILDEQPYCTLDRRRFGLRMIGMLLALSASCVFLSRLHASLPRTYGFSH